MTTGMMIAALRSARADDLVAVQRLLVDSHLPTAGVSELLAEHAGDVIIADDPGRPGELAAIAGLEVCSETALLRSVAVRPEWRAHGLGRALVQRAVCMAEARGLRALYLLTTTAEHYFPQFGFEPVARDAVPGEIAATLEFKGACPASAVAMARALSTPTA